MVEPGAQSSPDREEIHLLDLLAVFLRGWKVILGTTALGLACGVAFLLLQPRKYTAETVLVPSASASSSRGGAMQMQIPGRLLDLMPGSNTNERMIMAVIKSRSLKTAMMERIGEKAGHAEVAQALASARVQKRDEDGTVAIRVEARKPNVAVAVANEYPRLINEIVARTGTEAAQRKQDFLEAQLDAARDQLIASEQRLVGFQKQQDAPDPQSQAEQTVAAAAAIQQQINEQEAVVARLRRTSAPGNPRLNEAEALLGTRRSQLSRLTAGGGGRVFIPFGRSSEIRAATARLMRDFSKDEQIYNSLTAALAQVRIDAHNTLPVVSVLDSGVEPRTPVGSSPKVVLGAALVLSFLLGTIAVFVREQLRRARRSPAGEHFAAEWRQLRGEAGAPGNGRVPAGMRE